MRISLLLQREPFGQILENTLSQYWSLIYGEPFSVAWGVRSMTHRASGGPSQVWLANSFLNAIFPPDIESQAFEPIRREFSHSVVRWRRPFQGGYVSAALSPWGAPFLSQYQLSVSPGVPCSSHTLIVPGNHKIRLLDHRTNQSAAVLKHGFPSNFIEREMAVRRQAQELNIPVPVLITTAVDGSWFSEQYLCGTPLNRLSLPADQEAGLQQAARHLARLLTATCRSELLLDYASSLHTKISSLASASSLLSETDKQRLGQAADKLYHQLEIVSSAASRSIFTSITHGDFQPANILIERGQVWLIDWEYSERRQCRYDAFVFGLRARHPVGLEERLQSFIQHGFKQFNDPWWESWPGMEWFTPQDRRLSGVLFLLEELVLHLEENRNPLFFRLGPGLLQLGDEIERWLNQA
jgi:hypothetical protein